jgi:shikimate dehydrogenase
MATVYGLIGKKLGHSFSKSYFQEKFHSEHIDATFENFEMDDIQAFASLRLLHSQLRGVSVTIPYKEAIVPLLDALSPNAQAIGAVNCVAFRDGLAIGHNTDVIGFRDSLAEVYEAEPGGKALILGTGGAAKAVQFALQHYFEFDEIAFASRKEGAADTVTYAQLAEQGLGGYRLIVNATPLGMFPEVDQCPDLDLATLHPDCLVFDLIYNPEETKLLSSARARGCPTRNGLDMLIRQAEASWAIWGV